VIGPAACGPLEIIDDGQTGLLFVPGSAEDLAEALRRLYDDPDGAAKIAQAGREKAERCFSNEKQFAALSALLKEV
jgi:glycosyltransferase involved in cell wall biosynthesis